MKRYNKDVIFSHLLTGCLKKMVFCGKTGITTFKLIQNAKVGVFWKIQDISYNMGTEIFKTVEEMTDNEA